MLGKYLLISLLLVLSAPAFVAYFVKICFAIARLASYFG